MTNVTADRNKHRSHRQLERCRQQCLWLREAVVPPQESESTFEDAVEYRWLDILDELCGMYLSAARETRHYIVRAKLTWVSRQAAAATDTARKMFASSATTLLKDCKPQLSTQREVSKS
jgi:hypothetical protein